MPAKMLCWATPSGIERFFAEIGTLVEDPSAPPPPVTPTDIEKVMGTPAKYGITIVPH